MSSPSPSDVEVRVLERIADCASAARRAQTEYFRSRSAFALARAKNAEYDLDVALSDFARIREESRQPTLL